MSTEQIETKPWHEGEAPQDRAVWVQANVVEQRGVFDDVTPYEGFARWKRERGGWVDLTGEPLGECVVHRWMELADRARGCPAAETSLDASIRYWGGETFREAGKEGYYTLLVVYHCPTGVRLVDKTAGPYPIRAQAIAAMLEMVEEVEQ